MREWTYQICINKLPLQMSNRKNETVLPIIINNNNCYNMLSSVAKRQHANTSHNSTPYNHPNKWILTQSHVQKHISPKKIKLPATIQINAITQIGSAGGDSQAKDVFFTDINRREGKYEQQNQRLSHISIEKSTKFIDILKSNKKELLKIRMTTEPRISTQVEASAKSKQLFSYFQRDFVNSKKHNINNTVVQRFRTQSPEKIFTKIQVKSRKFLLQKMHLDYMNYNKIEAYKKQSIKTLIQQQIERKKKDFKQDYSKRYSSPYFYFLSLSKEERSNVMLRKQLNDENST